MADFFNHILYPVILVYFSVFYSLCILKFEYNKRNNGFHGDEVMLLKTIFS